MARALANPAINDRLVGGIYAQILNVNFTQFIGRLESAVIVGGGLPGNAARARDMSAAQHTLLRILGHVSDPMSGRR